MNINCVCVCVHLVRADCGLNCNVCIASVLLNLLLCRFRILGSAMQRGAQDASLQDLDSWKKVSVSLDFLAFFSILISKVIPTSRFSLINWVRAAELFYNNLLQEMRVGSGFGGIALRYVCTLVIWKKKKWSFCLVHLYRMTWFFWLYVKTYDTLDGKSRDREPYSWKLPLRSFFARAIIFLELYVEWSSCSLSHLIKLEHWT